MDWQKAYFMLFNSITDALAELARAEKQNPEMVRAEIMLQRAQQRTENIYIEAE